VTEQGLVILRALGLGDLLTAVPALHALAEHFPEYHRVLATTPAVAPLAVLTGTVHEVVPVEPLAPLPASIEAPAIAVNLHGRGPESHRILRRLRPGRLIAFAHPEIPETEGLPEWRAGEHEVHRWCRMLSEQGVPADPTRLDLVAPGFAPPTTPPDIAWGATLVHPGAASAARRWPVERWAAVARAERARGRRVVLTGAPADVTLARALARRAGLPDEANFAGRTSLLDLASLIAAAGRVVCGDTGVAHLATALRTPSVVLFGPVSPVEWGPPHDRPWHRALWAGRPGDPHGFAPDLGLLAISVARVLEALGQIDAVVAGTTRAA
jgi:ADP-heptose:LPS heptosyltransferase